jgi:hypothetical protein
LTALVWALNSAGFLAYLVWLATCRERIMEAREGVLYLLPCVAFLFVFACLLTARARDAQIGAKESGWNEARKL